MCFVTYMHIVGYTLRHRYQTDLEKVARRTDAKTTGQGITRNFNNIKLLLLLLLLQVVDIIHKVAVTSQGI